MPDQATISDSLIGLEFGHYRMLERVGSGGMGVVYRGLDSHLDREVAIKVLNPGTIADDSARKRFRNEAHALSKLNHPNIATIYDFETREGQDFLVMEYIPGLNLPDKLALGPVPEEEVLRLGVQLCDGLAAAHDHGVVHRDLKPGNLRLTSDGWLKILDFGLAKLREPFLQERGTATTLCSEAFAGTLAYMAPEQLTGEEEIDARTDIYAVGLILYEMATGQRSFAELRSGKLFAAILHDTPLPPRKLNPKLSFGLENIIEKCLVKDPKNRYQSAKELAIDLRRLQSRVLSGVGVQAAPMPTRWLSSNPLGLGLLVFTLTVVAAGLSIAWFFTRRPPSPTPRLTERRLTANPRENPMTQGAISLDGKYLAYADRTGMHLKLIQTSETINIPQPGEPLSDLESWFPNGWFPDGTKFIATMAIDGSHLSSWVVSVLGGPPRQLQGDADAWSVSPDGTLIAFGRGTSFVRFREIWLMGAQGEDARSFVSGSANDGFFWTAWSPDGHRIAYGRYHRVGDNVECSIESRDLKGGDPTVILSDPLLCGRDFQFMWSQTGHLVYKIGESDPRHSDENLWELRVDTPTGQPVSRPRRITNWTEVDVMSLSGTSDGKQLAVSERRAQADVYVGELQARNYGLKDTHRLTLSENNDFPGGWTADSKAVLFWSDRNGTWDIFRQRLDQLDAQLVVTGPDIKSTPRMSADGSWILYLSRPTADLGSATTVRIMRVPTSGGAPQMVLEGRGIVGLACARAPGTRCVFAEETADAQRLIFWAFDPLRGKGQELARVGLKQPVTMYDEDLSPDGSRLAFTQYNDREGHILILPLGSGERHELHLRGRTGLSSLSWAADGNGLFVSTHPFSGPILSYVGLDGRSETVWQQRLPGGYNTFGVPSPDGRRLALVGHSVDSNVWMLENF